MRISRADIIEAAPGAGLVCGLLLVAIIIAGGITNIIWGMKTVFILGGVSGAGSYVVIAIPYAITIAAVPFAIGWFVPKWGWLVALSYALLYLFIIVPTILWNEWNNSYVWTSDWGHKPFWLIPAAIGSSLLFSLVGSLLFKKKRSVRIYLERPVLSIAPVVAITLILSLVSSPLITFMNTEPGGTEKFPEYGFLLKKPRGGDIETKGRYNTAWPGDYRHNAVENVELTDGGFLKIHVYNKMPLSNRPFSSYPSINTLYDDLKLTLQGAADEPMKYLPQPDYGYELPYRLACFRWYGSTLIDNRSAIRLAFEDYNKDWSKYHIPGPYSSDGYDYSEIFVYKKPYLYGLEIDTNERLPVNERKKIFNEMKDRFRFI